MLCRYSHWSADSSVGWLRLSAIAPAAAAFIGGCRAPVSLAQGIAVRGRLLALRRRTSKDDAVPRNGGLAARELCKWDSSSPHTRLPKRPTLLVLCLVFIPPSSGARCRFVRCWFPRFRGFRPEGCPAEQSPSAHAAPPRVARRAVSPARVQRTCGCVRARYPHCRRDVYVRIYHFYG